MENFEELFLGKKNWIPQEAIDWCFPHFVILFGLFTKHVEKGLIEGLFEIPISIEIVTVL
jgi:hypothetical protein